MRLAPKTYHQPLPVRKMDITPMLDTMFSQAESLMAHHAELCETAGKQIAKGGNVLACALIRRKDGKAHEIRTIQTQPPAA